MQGWDRASRASAEVSLAERFRVLPSEVREGMDELDWILIPAILGGHSEGRQLRKDAHGGAIIGKS